MPDNFLTASEAIKGAGTAPPAVTTTATMPPLTAAGVDLARRTMLMIAVSVVILFILLLVQQCRDDRTFARANEAQFSIATAGAVSPSDGRVAQIAAELRRAAAGPKWAPTPSEMAVANLVVADVGKAPWVTASQVESLKICVPLPAAETAGRAAHLQECATALETLFVNSISPPQRIAVMDSIQKALAEERTAQRAFWLQVAQLVLINLLLPILTALLGYIFGTQQAQRMG